MTSPLPSSPGTPQTRSLADLEARLRTNSNAPQWPLLLTGGIVLALTLAAVVWGWGRISGLPTEVLTVKGQPMQVLTDPDWTTCTWQDRKQPCRPVDR